MFKVLSNENLIFKQQRGILPASGEEKAGHAGDALDQRALLVDIDGQQNVRHYGHDRRLAYVANSVLYGITQTDIDMSGLVDQPNPMFGEAGQCNG